MLKKYENKLLWKENIDDDRYHVDEDTNQRPTKTIKYHHDNHVLTTLDITKKGFKKKIIDVMIYFISDTKRHSIQCSQSI